MDRILARLERRFGWLAVPNLMVVVVVGMGIVWLLTSTHPEAVARLSLDWTSVRHGQIWRLGTFLFIPPASDSYWILITLYFTWWIGSSFEQHWGPFRFTVYYLFGALATVVASVFASPMSNAWLNDSLMLGFATVFPDVEILLFFMVSIRMKWIGAFFACLFAYEFALGDFGTRTAIAAALANYVLFFAEDGWRALRGHRVLVKQRARRADARQSAPPLGLRECAVCGAREADGADIRVCACDKCGGRPRNLCLAHARNH